MLSLKWLIKQNVPVLMKGNEWRIRRDAWLAGKEERAALAQVIRELFGVELRLESRYVVFHRAPSWSNDIEYAVECWGEGARLGILYYGADSSWGLIPSGALASILSSLGAEPVQVSHRGRLKGKSISIPPDVCRDRKYVLVRADDFIGVARVLDEEGCEVKVRDLAPSGFKPLAEPDPFDLLKYNEEVIETYASEAKSFIRSVYNEHARRGKIYVSFSGGADSTAVLYLAVEELGAERVVAVYSDTGLEFPQASEYVERVASKLGVELAVLKPSDSFLDEIRKRGLMSVEDRWCTSLLKLRPLREYYSREGARVYLDGARDYESSLRASTPRISENPALPGVLRALPIKSWPRILVQLYLLARKAELNPLYDRGFTRIGCVACPAMHKFELALSMKLLPRAHAEIIEASGLTVDEYLSMKWSSRRIYNKGGTNPL